MQTLDRKACKGAGGYHSRRPFFYSSRLERVVFWSKAKPKQLQRHTDGNMMMSCLCVLSLLFPSFLHAHCPFDNSSFNSLSCLSDDAGMEWTQHALRFTQTRLVTLLLTSCQHHSHTSLSSSLLLVPFRHPLPSITSLIIILVHHHKSQLLLCFLQFYPSQNLRQ